jgi:hypothetical protein
VPITAFVPLFLNGHVAAASVALTGLLAEFLVLALAGLTYRPGQLRSEFLFCGVVSLIILALMVAQLAAINLWITRRLPQLPRKPDTIAAVMTYVAGTAMVHDFDGLEGLGTRERNRAVRRLGKAYAYGWRRDDSGRVRWIVDAVDCERKSLDARPSTSHSRAPGDYHNQVDFV